MQSSSTGQVDGTSHRHGSARVRAPNSRTPACVSILLSRRRAFLLCSAGSCVCVELNLSIYRTVRDWRRVLMASPGPDPSASACLEQNAHPAATPSNVSATPHSELRQLPGAMASIHLRSNNNSSSASSSSSGPAAHNRGGIFIAATT